MATTWNPSDKAAAITLSNGNLDAVGNTPWSSVRATTSKSSGKWYLEMEQIVQAANSMMGFGTSGFSLSNYVGNTATGYGAQDDGQNFENGITVTGTNSGRSTSDILQFAWDFGAGKFWLGRNGTWLSSGNPAAGTNAFGTFTAGTTLFPACSFQSTTAKIRILPAIPVFSFTPPTGFQAWDLQTLSLTLSPASFTLTGIAATVGKLFKLTASAAAFVLTGIAVTVHATIHMILAPAAFVLTGVAATVGKQIKLLASVAAFALSGVAASFHYGRHMTAAPASFVLTGVANVLNYLPFVTTLLRKAKFVLQKLRVIAPSLED